MYVPVKAFLPDAEPLPVIVWVYGGGFVLGSKEQGGILYTGRSMLSASNHTTIFVAGNLPLRGKRGHANAGLYDQAPRFEWVREYIDKVKSMHGLSAGGSSILHHLIQDDGSHDSIQSFAAFSPGFEWAWNNTDGGRLDTIYKTFSNRVDCGSDCSIKCLQDISPEAIARLTRSSLSKSDMEAYSQ